jgi:hypothetical protein
MFEPQDHPDDIPYPGGPPTPPYDNAGYTVAYQMGVMFDRVLEGFEGPFEKINGLVRPPAGKVNGVTNAAGFLLSHQVNDSIIAVNRLLASGEEVYWLATISSRGPASRCRYDFHQREAVNYANASEAADEIGLTFDAVASRPRKKPTSCGQCE